MRRLADGLDRAVSLPAHTQQRPPRRRKHTRRSCPSRHGHGPLRFLAQGDDAFASASATACKPWPTSISLRGAPKHNLKDVSVEIPGSLTVMTGVSGSGTYNKSSLPTINLPCLGVHSISYDILFLAEVRLSLFPPVCSLTHGPTAHGRHQTMQDARLGEIDRRGHSHAGGRSRSRCPST